MSTPQSDKDFWREVNDLPSPAKDLLFCDKSQFVSNDTHVMWDPWRNQM